MEIDHTNSTGSRSRLFFLSFLGGLIGLIAGIVSFVLYNLIGLFTNLSFYHRYSFQFVSPQYNNIGILVILVPVIGGLIVGVMAKYGTSKIKGHGIPEAIEAVVINKSKISGKVAILKPLSAAIAIGTGGPFGAEGPIIQTGGAIGSLLGQFIPTTASERKILLACGAGAGMAATFSTPIAGVILAVELLLFEFKPRSFIPLVIATAVATAARFKLLGPGPMFHTGSLDFDIARNAVYFVVLGVLCGIGAIVFTKALYWTEDQFEKLPIDSLWWPAIGALGLGVIGFFIPRVFGVGYDTISDILNNNIALKILLLLMIFKSIALLVSLGSGTSGGLLAPMFMASAAMGGSFAVVVNHLIPTANLSPGAFALVAMGAVFGAAARSTFAFIVFSFEITRDYDAILPLMLVGVIASAIAISFLKNSIMTEKLARRGVHVFQEYDTDVLRLTPVRDVMDRNPAVVYAKDTVGNLADKIARNDPEYSSHKAYPVLDEQEGLIGIVTQGDLLKAIDKNKSDENVLNIAATKLVVTYADESVYDAVSKMLKNNIGRLPVVERQNPKKLIGYLGRANVISSRLKQIEEESVVEAHRSLTSWRSKREVPT
ncbi:MAG TPA: chloride channel protein [Candidatus Acidoferrales bacterium]|nr:chloride channel protein [Candidatus Acidoferrales bacterium]